MDYRALAQAFLDLQALLYQAPAARQLFSIDRGAWFAMQYLLRHGDVHPKELSREMGVTSARVAALLKGLERQGFAVRTADPSDSRKVLVRLTPAGREAVQAKRRAAIEQLADVLAGLGPQDAPACLMIEEKLVASFLRCAERPNASQKANPHS